MPDRGVLLAVPRPWQHVPLPLSPVILENACRRVGYNTKIVQGVFGGPHHDHSDVVLDNERVLRSHDYVRSHSAPMGSLGFLI